MPLYEYCCQICDSVYEAVRPMREASLPLPCPQCGRDGQRIMSHFSAFTVRDDGYCRPTTTEYRIEKPSRNVRRQRLSDSI